MTKIILTLLLLLILTYEIYHRDQLNAAMWQSARLSIDYEAAKRSCNSVISAMKRDNLRNRHLGRVKEFGK